MRSYNDYLKRKQTEHGEKFDASGLAQQFVSAFETGERITVVFRNDKGKVYDVKRGTIGITTGWKPVFLLMLTCRSIGSSYTLSHKDQIGTMEDYRQWKRQEAA